MDEVAPGHDGPSGAGGGQEAERARRCAHQLAAALRATAADAGAPGASDLADRLCTTAVDELGSLGATLCALFAPGMSVPVGVSDPTAARVEEIQFSAGEGPCWQAYADGEVVVADLADPAQAVRLDRLWPAYAPAVRRETGYGAVVAVPLVLTSGLSLVLTVYAAALHRDAWWLSAPVVTAALRDVLDAASPPVEQGGAVWLDSSSTLRRGAVWVAESLLVEEDPALDAPRALEALRTYGAVEGLTVDAAAAALVQGRLSAAEILGRR